MQRFIGTKIITAKPMNRREYNDYRNWPLPPDEDGNDDGYLVEYQDGGKPNHPNHSGYISWSPKEQFEKAYRPTNGLTFGLAIEALKACKRVARAGWNGKGMWLGLVKGYEYVPTSVEHMNAALGCMKLPWICMKTADNCMVPWLASQTDVLAEDWVIVSNDLESAES